MWQQCKSEPLLFDYHSVHVCMCVKCLALLPCPYQWATKVLSQWWYPFVASNTQLYQQVVWMLFITQQSTGFNEFHENEASIHSCLQQTFIKGSCMLKLFFFLSFLMHWNMLTLGRNFQGLFLANIHRQLPSGTTNMQCFILFPRASPATTIFHKKSWVGLWIDQFLK